MKLNAAEESLLEDLQDIVYTKEQADIYIGLDMECRLQVLEELRQNFDLRFESYSDGKFVKINDKYIKFEDFFIYLISAGYFPNILDGNLSEVSAKKVATA